LMTRTRISWRSCPTQNPMLKMKAFRTKIRAIDPADNVLKDFEGKPVFAHNRSEADDIIKMTQPYAEIFTEEPADGLLTKIINA